MAPWILFSSLRSGPLFCSFRFCSDHLAKTRRHPKEIFAIRQRTAWGKRRSVALVGPVRICSVRRRTVLGSQVVDLGSFLAVAERVGGLRPGFRPRVGVQGSLGVAPQSGRSAVPENSGTSIESFFSKTSNSAIATSIGITCMPRLTRFQMVTCWTTSRRKSCSRLRYTTRTRCCSTTHRTGKRRTPFVQRVTRLLLDLAGLSTRELESDRAARRRAWRVGWLRAARWILGLAACVLAAHWMATRPVSITQFVDAVWRTTAASPDAPRPPWAVPAARVLSAARCTRAVAVLPRRHALELAALGDGRG